MRDDKEKLIVISGGGTGGPSTAPLALALAYKQLDPTAKFLFIGNDAGLEKRLFGDTLADLGAGYLSLPAGKWRRYFSLKNFLDFFNIISAFFRVIGEFRRRRPALIISAGSFASVPVVWAGRLLGIKAIVHQQDLRPGLANRLMAPFAQKLTVTFPKSLEDYHHAVLIGNPSEAGKISEAQKQQVLSKFDIKPDQPFLLVTGGGSGALGLNRLFFPALPLLPDSWQIIHVTGFGKDEGSPIRNGYQIVPNLSHRDFSSLLSRADIVVSRAGLGALTELSISAKPTILVPMPDSHQEDNAEYFFSRNAAVVLKEAETDSEGLAGAIITLWENEGQRMKLAANIAAVMPEDAAENGAKIMKELIG